MNFVLPSKSFSILIFFLAFTNSSYGFYYAVLKAEFATGTEEFCVFSEKYPLVPEEATVAKLHIMQTGVVTDWCAEDVKTNASNKVLLLPEGNCSLFTQVRNFHRMGGKIVLFTNNGSLNHMKFREKEYLNETGIPAMKISKSSANALKKKGEFVTVQLFRPRAVKLIYMPMLLWLIAVFTTFVSSFASGRTSYKVFSKHATKVSHTPEVQRIVVQSNNGRASAVKRFLAHLKRGLRKLRYMLRVEVADDNGFPVMVFTPIFAVHLVLSSLLLMFFLCFFTKYMLTITSVIFTSITVTCMYVSLYSWTKKFEKYFSKCNITACEVVIPGLSLILAAISLAVPVTWAMFRTATYAWVLENVLCFFICCGILKIIRLPSLKVYMVILTMLFAVVVFYVHIIPLLTVNGKSILADLIATENVLDLIPGIFQVRDIGYDPLRVCRVMSVEIGFGDIFIPGYLLSYCYAFDLFSNERMVYYSTSVVSYGVGLSISCFADTFWRELPVIVWIEPAILIPIVLLSFCRGELGALWSGLEVKMHDCRKRDVVKRETNNNTNSPLDQRAEVP